MRLTQKRRESILKIITGQAVRTQSELVDNLEKEGFDVSQASISRDISALGLVKSGGRYVQRLAAQPADDPVLARLQDSVLSVKIAGDNLLVLKTPPGEASGTAVALDRLNLSGLVGSIAGDDTVFIAVANKDSQGQIKKKFLQVLGPGVVGTKQ